MLQSAHLPMPELTGLLPPAAESESRKQLHVSVIAAGRANSLMIGQSHAPKLGLINLLIQSSLLDMFLAAPSFRQTQMPFLPLLFMFKHIIRFPC